MARRIWVVFLCSVLLATLAFLSGCSNKYEDKRTGITVKDLGSDLDNKWAFRGVVVELVSPGSPADGLISPGEVISYVVIETPVTDEGAYKKALKEALKDDERAMLRMLKSVSATSEKLLLSVKMEAQGDLNNDAILEALQQGIKDSKISLSNDASVSMEETDAKWLITDGDKVYTVKKQADKLNVFSDNDLGITVKSDPEGRGVIADQVAPGSEAYKAGILWKTIIYKINDKPTTSVEEYNRVLKEALASSSNITLSVGREIAAPKLSEFGIEEVQGQNGSVSVTRIKETKGESPRAVMEGIKEGDVITHVIDEMKIVDIGSYKKAMKKAADADKIILKRGELGGIKLDVVQALGRIGDAKAVDPLLKALESKDRKIRQAAAEALEDMGGDRVAEQMTKYLLEDNEKDVEIRISSARSLARMKRPESINDLVQALGDPSLRVRQEAASALSKIGGEKVISALREALEKAKEDFSVEEDQRDIKTKRRIRDSAVAALGKIGGESAREELLKILEDDKEQTTVKLTAIEALNEIGDNESLQELSRVIKDEDKLRRYVDDLLLARKAGAEE